MTDAQVNELARRLGDMPLFAGCYPADLVAIARRCEVRHMPPGAHLIRAGDHGDELFILLSGVAQRGAPGEWMRQLGPGDYFGELALLDPAPRAMDVVTLEDCTVGVLSGANFRVLLHAVPGVAPHLLAALARRVRAAERAHD